MADYGFRTRDRAALDFINDCIEQAHAIRKELEPQWSENWSNYRVESTMGDQLPSKQYPMASSGSNFSRISPVNFLKTPESHQGINTLRSLLLAGLFGVRDYIQADPVGGEDVEKALRVSRLLMYGCERPGNFRTMWETLGDSLICGLGSYTARWKDEQKLVPRRIPVPDPMNPGSFVVNPETGSIMTVLKYIMAPVYSDVTLENDDLFDTWFDPSANRFEDAKWKVKRFRIRDEELIKLLEDQNWDAEGIQQVLTHDPDELGRETGPDSTSHPKLITENLTVDDMKDVKSFGYYGGWMFEGAIPAEIANEVGEIDSNGSVIIRIINGICVQAIQSPQRNGRLQGGSITILPTGRGIYGLSPLTVVRYLQDVSDTQLILTVQALIEAVYQNYVFGGDLGPNIKRQLETRRPREVFGLQGDVDQLQPLPKDYTGLGIAVQSLNVISQTIRNAMNARDPVQGIFRQTGEQTATESQLVASSALQNTDQLAVLIERDELPMMGRLINDLYYVNLDDDGKVFRRVGDSMVTNVSYFDIDSVTDISFVGARSVLSRQAKANQFRDFAQMLASNPFTAAATNWHELVRRYGDEALDLKGLEQLMIQDPDEIVARMQAMGLGNTLKGGTGGGAGGGAGQGGGVPADKGRKNPGSGGKKGGTPTQNAGETQ